MSRWFRFYSDAMRNPKVMRLSDKDFRVWVKLLAVASENDGGIPCLDDLRLLLSMRLDHLSSSLDRLISGRLIDVLDTGYAPHGWAKFQYKSDTSTDRVKKHRGKGNVSETPSETDTEAETERVIEDKPLSQPVKARGSRIPSDFEPSPVPQPIADLLALWPPGREQRELEGFRDYWLARTKDAAKLDWDKTWHNRIRDQHDRIMRENRNGRFAQPNIRGSRPDPAVDLYNAACAAEEAERLAGHSETGRGDWLSLPSYGTG